MSADRVAALAAVLGERTERTPTCWLWTGALNRGGYGLVSFDSKRRMAHRVAYELVKGPIPKGLVLDHLCRVRNCVNPDHLEPVTNRENVLRGIGLSAIAARRNQCEKGHAYVAGSWRWKLNRRTGRQYRSCRICAAAYKRQVWRREKERLLAIRYPIPCPMCPAGVGQECLSSRGKRLGKNHVARTRAIEARS